MYELNDTRNRRILVIDDNVSIHADFRKILTVSARGSSNLDESYAALFGEEIADRDDLVFEVDSASQGQEGLEKVKQAMRESRPYAMAFVDVRMPPGWDGIETVGRLWEVDPDLLVVICTAHNDYDWSEMSQKLGARDRWLIVKKPFDHVEVRQLAASLTEKWELARKAELKFDELQKMVQAQNSRLAAFRNAVDVAGIVAVTDQAGTLLEVNDNFCQTSGYEREELIGQNLSLLAAQDATQPEVGHICSALLGGKLWRGETCQRAKDGSLYWVDTTIVPMPHEDDRGEGYFALNIEISERKRLMEQLQTLAYRDTLTGLPNRPAILQSIQEAIHAPRKRHFALLFLDFDRFKLINDSLGHESGDELLKQIAGRLRSSLRSRDKITPARLGGDEFVVLLNDLNATADAIEVAQRLLQVFSEGFLVGGNTVYSTASIGIVTSEHCFASASEMIRDADLAMYEAKRKGRGGFVLYDEALREKANRRLRLETELREAIDHGQLEVAYQPIIALESGQRVGVEALMRWWHPELGDVPPTEFIPIAEETGLIIRLGAWILEEACRQWSFWRRNLAEQAPDCLHVNVSRKQLLQPDFIEIVAATLERHAVPPENLHLEVTETLFMEDQTSVIATLTALRDRGIKIDMDDFGTEYSTLSCLHELPLDLLKIDRVFITNVGYVRDFAALLHAVMTLADNLDLKVVAEGVENAEQLALLQALGCDFGQGFFLAKPMLAADAECFFRQTSNLMTPCAPVATEPVITAS